MSKGLLTLILVLLPAVAFAQEAAEVVAEPTNWIALAAAFLVPLASLAAAIFPDGHPVMKAINFVALNFGKAKNDSRAQ